VKIDLVGAAGLDETLDTKSKNPKEGHAKT
jgi:hypothetical protein